MNAQALCHLTFTVDDIAAARNFYGDPLGIALEFKAFGNLGQLFAK
jgi:extradiol dioxygenase family protein